MSRKSYSREFKESTVRLMVIDGLSASKVSQQLGVSEGFLYRWKQQQVGAIQFFEGLDAQVLVAKNEHRQQATGSRREDQRDTKKTVGYFAVHQS